MVHTEEMTTSSIEGTMHMYMSLAENVRAGTDEREVAVEMMRVHLEGMQGMTIAEKAMEAARKKARKKIKGERLLAVLLNSGSKKRSAADSGSEDAGSDSESDAEVAKKKKKTPKKKKRLRLSLKNLINLAWLIGSKK